MLGGRVDSVQPAVAHWLEQIIRNVVFIFFLQLFLNVLDIIWESLFNYLGICHEHIAENVIAVSFIWQLMSWFEI